MAMSAGLWISVLEVSAFTPGTRLIAAIVSINVQQLVLHDRVPCPHQVVEEYTGLDYELHSLHTMPHFRQDHLKAICQYTEGILNYPSGSRESVVEYPLPGGQRPASVRLHHELPESEGIITHQMFRVFGEMKFLRAIYAPGYVFSSVK